MKAPVVVEMLAALSLCACAGSAPAPVGSEPAGDDLESNLAARGVSINRIVPGDAGCPNRGYDDRALRMDVGFGDAGAIYSIYLIEWSDLRTFNEEGARDQPGVSHPVRPYRECVADFLALHLRPVVQVESYPWRAFGLELPEALRQVVIDSMHAAGGM